MEIGVLGAVILHAPKPVKADQRQEHDLVIILHHLVEVVHVRVQVAHPLIAMQTWIVQVAKNSSDFP